MTQPVLDLVRLMTWLSPALPAGTAYPVAVGAMAAAACIDCTAAIGAYCQAFASNMVQAAIRLSVTGQSGGVRVLSRLEPVVTVTAARAAASTLDDLGSATILSEIMAMKHETQASRLFRS